SWGARRKWRENSPIGSTKSVSVRNALRRRSRTTASCRAGRKSLGWLAKKQGPRLSSPNSSSRSKSIAITNPQRAGKALEFLKQGLEAFVEREMKAQHAQRWFEEARDSVSDSQANLFGTEKQPKWDVASILSVMWNQWNVVFKKTLGQAERTLVSELRDVRN